MELLRGFPGVSVETVEFRSFCPQKWKCSSCGVLVASLWRNSRYLDQGVVAKSTTHSNHHLPASPPATYCPSTSPSTSPSASPSTLSTCRHRLCAQCLDQLANGSNPQTFRCPLDATLIRKQEMLEEAIQSEAMLDQDVFCSHKSRGCRKVTQLRDLESHLKSCLYGLVHCPLKCGQGITIKSLPDHMAHKCSKRVVSCRHCEDEIPLDSQQDHEESCPKRPVSCKYCNNDTVIQDTLKQHYDLCPSKPRNCRLVALGCKFTGTRQQVDEHEKRWDIHMELVLKQITLRNSPQEDKVKNRLGDLVAIIKDLNAENEVLKEGVEKLTVKAQCLEANNKALTERMTRLEASHKSEIVSMKNIIEVLRAEVESLKTTIRKTPTEDEESEV